VSPGELSITRGVTTAMIYICLIGFGVFSLSRIPLNRLPDVDLPVIAVITTYVGASPEDVETLLTSPIERAVSSVEGVEKVESTSRQGTSIVIISFTWGTDMDAAETEVRKNLELFAQDFLPDEASRPLTFAFDPSLAPVMFLSLDGPLDGHQLRQLATEQVQPYLGRVEGVAAAEVMGGLDREVRVELSPLWLEAYGISPTHVVDALRGANLVVPSGAIDDGTQRLAIQPTSLFSSVEEIEDVIVGQRGGRPVHLREVATVTDAFEEETHIVTANGEAAVMLAVRKQSDANTVEVARAVAEALPRIEGRLPEGVHLVPLFDESQPILRAIKNLGSTALQAFLLTGLVLLIFLRSWRTSLICIIAVPTSVVVAFAAMLALDVTMNLVSMAGLALAIGMLVDNGIVVLEAAFQEIEKGASRREAAVRGAREMSMPVVASTLTTVVVFLPILFVEGIAGELFRDMVLTICVSLLASLVVALTLVPLMAAHWTGRAETRFERLLKRWTFFIDKLGPAYERSLAWSLAHRKTVLGLAVAAFAASLGVVPFLGQDFLPKSDVSEVRIEVTAAPGTSLDEMRTRIGGVEAMIRETVPEALVVTADYGTAEGFGAIFGGTANRGTLRVRLPQPSARERTQQEIEEALSARFPDVPGLDVEIASFSLGGSGSDVEVKIFGEDLEELRDFGERLRNEIASIDGVRDARFSMMHGSPELSLRYDRERMRVLGLSPAVVASTVAAYYQGVPATMFREGGDEYVVRVRSGTAHRRELDELRYLPIPLPVGGGTVPLGSIAEVRDRLGPIDIERENQRRHATIEITRMDDTDLGAVIQDVEARIAREGTPEGMSVEVAGTAEDLRESFVNLGWALLAALMLVYMVMASQFESLLEPFVIMFTVPLAVMGVVLALALSGTSVQVTALVGVILLIGVIVNNGIVLIDVLKRRRAEGKNLVEASLEAARTRLRPILMTALTTILGMVPLAFGVGDGAETWAPMGRAVVGGMTVGTVLTLYVIPVLYVAVVGRVGKWRKKPAIAVAPPAPVIEEEAAQ
jgi:HAE1 family hydrophobic/amphiphilic exporter-1